MVAPQKGREVHKNRIGMVMSTPVAGKNLYSVKFADKSLVSFFAKEIEIFISPTALSYLKIKLYSPQTSADIIESQKVASTLADRQISDAAKAKAAEELRALKMGNQVLVVAPRTGREMHKDRIGMVMSTPVARNNFYSVKFADESLVSFYAKELEICPSPTALSYLKI